ncbi:hypothetical protein [Chryseobacterium polytrichastri]|uniref:NVEALA protein n=1 Tax=Chryseobacterium polytrichastri TaxID=1302687 RepID=A0A1M7K0N6_9FLAO|nr:hypothetical protein [Chryseobacterium polytrichastri]SHM58784.1 hypothetical protein SAMN05444267_10564 [Chryseobacterium polytrichastri]
MKTLKIAVAALIIAGGTLGAFAFTKAEKSDKKVLNTYYPVKTAGSSFTWQQLNPADYECVSGGAACAGYIATSPPADNTIPTGYTTTNHALQPK